MTINKSQGQSFKYVGGYIPEDLFGHGQLYVFLSRVTDRSNIKLLITNGWCEVNDCFYVKNVVYNEALLKIENEQTEFE